MNRFTVTPGITFHIEPAEGVVFSDAFKTRIKDTMDSVCSQHGALIVAHVTERDNALFIAFGVRSDGTHLDYQRVLSDIQEALVVLSEHGKDSDILQQLLERHPSLKDSPEVHRAIGAFDNMLRVIEEVEKSEDDPRVIVKKQAAERHGFELAPERLASKKSGIQIPNRHDHRKRALKGQNPDQVEEAKKAKDPSPVPPVYKQVMGSGKPSGGDGNVFNG